MFLFIPGIISVMIIDTLTTHRKRKVFHFIVHAFLLGTLSYTVLSFMVWINNKIVLLRGDTPTWKTNFIESLLNGTELGRKINPIEILIASLLGTVIGILIVLSINRSWYYRFFNVLGITNKHGDGDVWEYILNSKEVEWVNIRDKDNGLIYQGAVRAFSEKDDKRELHLSDVIVYDDEKDEELYCMDYMYFNFNVNSNIFMDIYSSERSVDDEQKE